MQIDERTGPTVWLGEDKEKDPSWIIRLRPDMIDEIEDRVRSTSELELPFDAGELYGDRPVGEILDYLVELKEFEPEDQKKILLDNATFLNTLQPL